MPLPTYDDISSTVRGLSDKAKYAKDWVSQFAFGRGVLADATDTPRTPPGANLGHSGYDVTRKRKEVEEYMRQRYPNGIPKRWQDTNKPTPKRYAAPADPQGK